MVPRIKYAILFLYTQYPHRCYLLIFIRMSGGEASHNMLWPTAAQVVLFHIICIFLLTFIKQDTFVDFSVGLVREDSSDGSNEIIATNINSKGIRPPPFHLLDGCFCSRPARAMRALCSFLVGDITYTLLTILCYLFFLPIYPSIHLSSVHLSPSHLISIYRSCYTVYLRFDISSPRFIVNLSVATVGSCFLFLFFLF